MTVDAAEHTTAEPGSAAAAGADIAASAELGLEDLDAEAESVDAQSRSVSGLPCAGGWQRCAVPAAGSAAEALRHGLAS